MSTKTIQVNKTSRRSPSVFSSAKLTTNNRQLITNNRLQTTNNQLVSVIMPVYNAENYVAQAIQSIVDQTYTNIELIIVDDASTDNSWNIIQSFKDRYPKKIHAFQMKHNLNRGGDACANVAYEKAKGTFIARMDADDIADPKRIAVQVAYLQKHPDVLLVGSQAHVIDQLGNVTGDKLVPESFEEIYKAYFVFHPIIHPTVMIRKSLLPKRKHLYKINYSANNDLYTFFGLLNRGKFINLPDKLLYYRVHGKNDSLTKPKERFFNTLKIRLWAVRHTGYKPTIKAIITTMIQTMAIIILPEPLIVPVYLYVKGISKTLKGKTTSYPSPRKQYALQ